MSCPSVPVPGEPKFTALLRLANVTTSARLFAPGDGLVVGLHAARRPEDVRAEAARHQCVAVRFRARDLRRAERAAGAWAVLDHELLLERPGEVFGDQTCHPVGAAAGGEGDHHTHRLGRPFLRGGAGRQGRGEQTDGKDGTH
jgi:hypothetical protein